MKGKVRQQNLFAYLKYSLASIFVVWHCGALLVAPAPASYIVNEAYSWYKPYLTLLNLNNGWAFFAPDPHPGALMQYLITDQQGDEHLYDFTSLLDRKTVVFQRYTMMLDYVAQKTEPYTESAGLFFCQQHKDLNPVQIQFRFYFAKRITPEAYIDGVRPLDKNNLELEILEPIKCPT